MPKKDDVVLRDGPYTNQEEKVYETRDEETFEGEYGKHLYRRTVETNHDRTVFAWGGPVFDEKG